MGLERRLNTWLIKFVIGSSYMKKLSPQNIVKEAKVNGIDKLKDFFDTGIKQMKKDMMDKPSGKK